VNAAFVPHWGRRGTAGASIPKALAFRDVALQLGRTQVLAGVRLDVRAGEVLALLGPSGCGKTTLLRVAAGLERPDAGDVVIDGESASAPNAFIEPEDRGVGFMFQDYALFPHLTALANVAFGLRDLSRSERETLARRALARVGLDDRASDFPHMLSGGEQQRVALARAIAPRPGAMLMDEPFSNLDRRMRDSVREETAALLRETGATAIVVTHDPEEAMRIADRIALMRDGVIVQAGPAEALYTRPADLFAARFFCDLNEIAATANAGSVTTPFGKFTAMGRTPGEAVYVCVRPQAIRLSASGQAGIAGRIVSRRFLGDMVAMELAVAGLDDPLRARFPTHLVALLRGDGEVSITIDPSGVLVFPADAAMA
jgi:iron(III) transport system ATP-binding protein